VRSIFRKSAHIGSYILSAAVRVRKEPVKRASRKKAVAVDGDGSNPVKAASSSNKPASRKRKVTEDDEDDAVEIAPVLKKRPRPTTRKAKKVAAPIAATENGE
jgi:hypothetical protein